uniref:TTF-type domain-containing protein n=1 Tax=Amphimedon queenslandica TaxID=400682 RepID=A0A1X7V3Y4_AMPQE
MSRQLSLLNYMGARNPTRAEKSSRSIDETHESTQSTKGSVERSSSHPGSSGTSEEAGSTCTGSSQVELDDIASSTSSPCQPVKIKFPVTYFSGKARSFYPDWFKLYPWLEYSVSKDAAFCYACRLFLVFT